jgi:antitoxin PrlF
MSKHKTYNINPAKIGNQKGFRLPNAFYQDNPHLADASGQVEVINDDTLLIHLDTKNDLEEENEESLMMSLFLDFLMKDVIKNPDKLIPYTEEMSDEVDELLKDVNLEEE